jgi:hypothetical protein
VPPVIVESLVAIARTNPQRKQANVTLELLTATGNWWPFRWRVDTGASASLLSWDRFGPAGLNLDLRSVSGLRPVVLNGPTGTVTRAQGHTAIFQARFPGHPAWVFSWGAVFLAGLSGAHVPLLGIGSRILSDVHITFRGWTSHHPAFLPGSVAFDIQIPPTVPPPPIATSP